MVKESDIIIIHFGKEYLDKEICYEICEYFREQLPENTIFGVTP